MLIVLSEWGPDMLSISRVLPFLAASLLIGSAAPAETPDYDFDNGNAAVEVAIQTIAPLIFEELSPTAGDASLVLRATAMTTYAINFLNSYCSSIPIGMKI